MNFRLFFRSVLRPELWMVTLCLIAAPTAEAQNRHGAELAQATRPASQPASQPSSQPASQPASQPSEPLEILVPPVPDVIANARDSGKRVLIHYTTSFEHDDNPGCVAFNVAFEALAQGHQVEFFFDAGGVQDLKLWEGRPVAFQYALPDRLKELLSDPYSIAIEDLPETYQDYLYWLHEMGAEITYNGFMAALVSLTPSPREKSDQLIPIAQPRSLGDLMDAIESSDFYVKY